MTSTSDLPAGWAVAPLGELADVVRGVTYKKHQAHSSAGAGRVRLLRATNITQAGLDLTDSIWVDEDCISNTQRLDAGDILVTASSGSLAVVGRSVVVPAGTDATFGAFCAVIRPHADIGPYLAVYLSSPAVRRLWSQQAAGTNINNLKRDHLLDLLVPVPPLGEQRRIAEELAAHLLQLDRSLDAMTPLDRHLERAEESVIQAAVLGQLVPGVRGATPAQQHLAGALEVVPTPDTPHLPALPAGWAWTTLGALCDVSGGVTKDAKKQSDPSHVEVPYLRVANVQRGRLDLGEVNRIRVPPAKAEALRLLPGDVLFNEGGDRDKLGRGWVWEGQIPGCIHQNHVFRGRILGGVLDPRLLSWHGNTFGRRWFESAGKQTTNLASLSMTNLKRLPVPVPPPEDQPLIVAELQRRLSIIQAARGDLAALRDKTQVLRRSLLRTAVTGQLVDQDPAEESAELLLKRIAEDRAAAAPTARRRARSDPTARHDMAVELVEESA